MSTDFHPYALIALAIGVVVVLMILIARWNKSSSTKAREHIERLAEEAVQRAARSTKIDERQLHDLAREATQKAAQEAQDAAIRAYQEQQDRLRQEQSEKRRETAAKAQQTKQKKIEALQQWRDTFVGFVRALAKPYFSEWELPDDVLTDWSEERSDYYIKWRPYVLEIIQMVHADAQKAAESYANKTTKSTRELSRERARSVSRKLERNLSCPYCQVSIDSSAPLDHIIPAQLNGPGEAWNLVYVCKPCNQAKGSKPLIEFIDSDYARRKGLRLSEIRKRLEALGKIVNVLR